MKLRKLSKREIIRLSKQQCKDCVESFSEVKKCSGRTFDGVCPIHPFRLLDYSADHLPPKKEITDALVNYCRVCLQLTPKQKLFDCESEVCNLRLNGYESRSGTL